MFSNLNHYYPYTSNNNYEKTNPMSNMYPSNMNINFNYPTNYYNSTTDDLYNSSNELAPFDLTSETTITSSSSPITPSIDQSLNLYRVSDSLSQSQDEIINTINQIANEMKKNNDGSINKWQLLITLSKAGKEQAIFDAINSCNDANKYSIKSQACQVETLLQLAKTIRGEKNCINCMPRRKYTRRNKWSNSPKPIVNKPTRGRGRPRLIRSSTESTSTSNNSFFNQANISSFEHQNFSSSGSSYHSIEDHSIPSSSTSILHEISPKHNSSDEDLPQIHSSLNTLTSQEIQLQKELSIEVSKANTTVTCDNISCKNLFENNCSINEPESQKNVYNCTDKMKETKSLDDLLNSTQSTAEYEVEKIVRRKTIDDQVYYFVKWVGYDSTYNTWEPVEGLSSCSNLIERFESKKLKKDFDLAQIRRSGRINQYYEVDFCELPMVNKRKRNIKNEN